MVDGQIGGDAISKTAIRLGGPRANKLAAQWLVRFPAIWRAGYASVSYTLPVCGCPRNNQPNPSKHMPGRRLDIDLEFLWLDQKAAREPPVALVFFFFPLGNCCAA